MLNQDFGRLNFIQRVHSFHRFSDVSGRGKYDCSKGRPRLLGNLGGQYEWGVSVDAVNNRVNAPFDIGVDRYYYLVQ